LALVIGGFAQPMSAADFTQADAAKALRRAVDFFRTQVAVQGGYVWAVSGDLKQREGENKVTPTRVWTQPPSTSTVGQTLLDIYLLTGDEYYLKAARETAECLLRGQLRSGGWSEWIDFDPKIRRQFAYRVDSPEGNAEKLNNQTTLDDNKTQSCAHFLMRLDAATKFRDAPLHEAVRYALDKLVEAQYPNGAWPQQFAGPCDPAKFPVLKASYPAAWSRTFPKEKYSGHYTFNDGNLGHVVRLLLEASRTYDEPRYRRSAERLGDFILLAQMPEPQPTWAQQYDAEMHPAWARKFEPPSVTGGESQGIILTLIELYRATGEKRFLEPIPSALAWLKKSELPDGNLARFYELQTNKPLYFTKQYELTYDDGDVPTHYGFKVNSKLKHLQTSYAAVLAEKVPAKFVAPAPRTAKWSRKIAAEAGKIADALDDRGAWVEQGKLRAQDDGNPQQAIITTRTFVENALTLARAAAAQ
jgi:PelA/Pel-15E family pectate lyase